MGFNWASQSGQLLAKPFLSREIHRTVNVLDCASSYGPSFKGIADLYVVSDCHANTSVAKTSAIVLEITLALMVKKSSLVNVRLQSMKLQCSQLGSKLPLSHSPSLPH
jgi:hypothetical protein